MTVRDTPCPTSYILPAPRQSHLATAPAGQDPLPLSRLTEHVHDLLASALSPCGGREQQDSPGRGPERAGTEGRPSTHLRVQGTQSSLLDFACRRTRPLTFLPHGEDFSHAQVPAPGQGPRGLTQGEGWQTLPALAPCPPHSPGTSHSSSSAKPTPPGSPTLSPAPATRQMP